MQKREVLAAMMQRISGKNPLGNGMLSTFFIAHEKGEDGEITVGNYTFQTRGFSRTLNYKNEIGDFKPVPGKYLVP